ncbi:TatD family hydrolase [Candidatus Nanopusillus massiliensis]|uniref:TatD family hydrolase n=1 Tax=Candidatus Nanopusillus massiliensis TaxID=2897163 RepID=UPI001E5296F3|nr:TatD family hydrolase [Candidatus Nanopusillus massiliensis]
MKLSLADKAIETNCYLSIPTIVYRDPGFQKIVKEIPLEFILTETDSPYLDPIEKGKAVNNSWKIIYSLEKISEIKDIDKKEVEEMIFNNFVKVYNINNDE